MWSRSMSGTSLCVTERKPFDVLAEGPDSEDGVSGRHAFEPWAKAYLKNFASPLSTDVRIVAQLARDAVRSQPSSL